VYAPMYPQGTLVGGSEPFFNPFPSVLASFEEFLAKYDKGRGFVLIGHSQGSDQLDQLIPALIEKDPEVAKKMVSAVILGGDVTVPDGQIVGGMFKKTPLCQTANETHCVVAYSSFYQEPPAEAGLGRTLNPGEHVACVNPAQLVQDESSSALLSTYQPTFRFPGIIGTVTGEIASAGTPWVSTPGEYSAQCHWNSGGAGWLQIKGEGTPHDPDEFVQELIGPADGLHLFDFNLALGNLVRMVALQTQQYLFEGEV